MKKGRIFGTAILGIVMAISTFATGAFGERPSEMDSYRVLIQGPAFEKAKAKANYGVRWEFEEQGFTTTVNAKQYQALLKNKNLTIKIVPEEQLISKSEMTAKPGATAGSAPSDRTPWGIQAIYNDQNIAATSGGKGIKVAVLDTGVNASHVDLAGNMEQCKDFSQNKTPLVEGSCADGNGHGTHVSGTVLANGGSNGQGIYGVAPEAKLWSYKVLNNRGSGYSDDIAAAIRKAADEGTRTGSKVIVSMSLGSSTNNSLISSAVDYAYSKGVLIVAAAGNEGPASNTIGYPGALVNAVAVAALEDVQQNGTYRVADFSSRGNPNTDEDFNIQEKDVEVSAPGRAIESTWKDGGYNTISGTSMATPHVSGLAAKIWAANLTWSNVQIRSELQNKAKAYDIKGGTGSAAGDDYASGFGFPRVK